MKKREFSVMQLVRHLCQLAFFIFLPALYISAFNGIKQIFLAVTGRSFSFGQLAPQLIEAACIIPVTMVMGRFFCGWMCSLGAFGDFIYGISGGMFKRKFKISEKADEVLKYGKHAVLAFLIAVIWSFDVTAFSSFNPWDVFGMFTAFGKLPDFKYIATNMAGGLVLFILIAIGSAFVERFFCRYLCPLGAVFDIVSRLRIARIRKPSAKCGACRMCTRSCAMGIPLYKHDDVKSGECIQCMKCITACPRNNVTLTVSEKDARPMVAGAAVVSLMTGLHYAGNIGMGAAGLGNASAVEQSASVQEPSTKQNEGTPVQGGDKLTSQESKSTTNQSSQDVQSNHAAYKDGTYEGTGTGFRGAQTTVSVVVKNGRITDVTTVSHGDDKPFYNRAFTTVSREIMDSQSTDVDSVSGATFSSRGIMAAVENALAKAK